MIDENYIDKFGKGGTVVCIKDYKCCGRREYHFKVGEVYNFTDARIDEYTHGPEEFRIKIDGEWFPVGTINFGLRYVNFKWIEDVREERLKELGI